MADGALQLHGRHRIFTSEKEISDANIVDVLRKAFAVHLKNRDEITYLKEYHRGIQPILQRTKEIRPEINNKVVENHAAEIVSFKVGYVFGSPIQLVLRGKCEPHSGNFICKIKSLFAGERKEDTRIATLNEMMFEQGKAEKDVELGEDLAVCGVGYRMVLPKKFDLGDLAPFDVMTLLPENTFVVKSNDVYRRPMLGVSYTIDPDTLQMNVGAYSDTLYWEFQGIDAFGMNSSVKSKTNPLGMIPIVEYENNKSRMGSFEVVLPLLDAVNNATSDRLNDIAQFVQSLLWFNNCDIDEEQFEALGAKGGIKTKSEPGNPASVQYLTGILDQSGTQIFKDDLYQTILTIAGVPDRRSSTGGNTGQAIMLASGWATAESHARITETVFGKAEKQFLRIILRILRDSKGVDANLSKLALSDIDIKFSRNKNDNLLTKTQGLINQLEAGVHPRIAIANCGLYSDPEQVYQDSIEFLEKWKTQKETQTNNQPQSEERLGAQSQPDNTAERLEQDKAA